MRMDVNPVPVLKGIRVLDFGRYLAGPYCATLLGYLGAEVYPIGTTRKRGDYQGTMMARGLPDVLAFMPARLGHEVEHFDHHRGQLTL